MSDKFEPINHDFPITVADGAYVHFLEGFASILFYQNRVVPRTSGAGIETNKKIEIIGDIRLSINSLELLVHQIEEGFGVYQKMGMLQNNIDFFTDFRSHELPTEEYKITQFEKNTVPIQIELTYPPGTTDLTEEGQKLWDDTIKKMINEHYAELRMIIHNYKKETENNAESEEHN